jgi:hypothetical protein
MSVLHLTLRVKSSVYDRSTRARMYGPAARRKTDFQDDEREVLHQCIRPRQQTCCGRMTI